MVEERNEWLEVEEETGGKSRLLHKTKATYVRAQIKSAIILTSERTAVAYPVDILTMQTQKRTGVAMSHVPGAAPTPSSASARSNYMAGAVLPSAVPRTPGTITRRMKQTGTRPDQYTENQERSGWQGISLRLGTSIAVW